MKKLSLILVLITSFCFANDDGVEPYSHQVAKYELPSQSQKKIIIITPRKNNTYLCKIGIDNETPDKKSENISLNEFCKTSNNDGIITSDPGTKPLLISTKEYPYFLLWKKNEKYSYLALNTTGATLHGELNSIRGTDDITSMIEVGNKVVAFGKKSLMMVSNTDNLITSSWTHVIIPASGDFVDAVSDGTNFVSLLAVETSPDIYGTKVISGNSTKYAISLLNSSSLVTPKKIIYNKFSNNKFKYVILTEYQFANQPEEKYKIFFFDPETKDNHVLTQLAPFSIIDLSPTPNGYIGLKYNKNLIHLDFNLDSQTRIIPTPSDIEALCKNVGTDGVDSSVQVETSSASTNSLCSIMTETPEKQSGCSPLPKE